MRTSPAVTILLAFLFSATVSFAAPFQETVKPQGLLILEDFRQWVGLSYEYIGHNSDKTGNAPITNRFIEKYHLTLATSIFDTHVLALLIDGEAGFEQSQVTDRSGGGQSNGNNHFLYSIYGSLFDQSPLPITFNSSRDVRTVVTPFTPAYTSDTFTNGITAVVHNKYVPLTFRYWRLSTDLTGGGNDSTSTSNNFYLQAEHSIPDFSHTRLTGVITQQEQQTSGQLSVSSSSHSFSLSNGLEIDRGKKYSLSSSIVGSESLAAQIPQQTLSWQETLNCRFGKTLWGVFDYRYDYNKTLGFDNLEQVARYSEATGSITHRLFSSLDTSVAGRYRTSEISGGNETIYGGSASATYRKHLPLSSELMLSVKGEHELTDRRIPGVQFSVRDEEHKNVQQGDSIILGVSGNQVQVISVKSRLPDRTYIEFFDYTVSTTTGRIDILAGGGIAPGVDLFISYSVQHTPLVKYTTDTINTTLDLSLLNNRYRILGNYMTQNRDVASAQADNLGLYNSMSATLHAEANYLPHSFSAEYGLYDSGQENYSYWEGGWRFEHRFSQQGLAFKARERYLTREITGATRRQTWENLAEFGASYTRPLFAWANATASLNYINTIGENYRRDYAYLKLNFQGRINKLYINMIGQSTLRIRQSDTVRDDYVLVEVKRYF